jgi:YjbE family integral membrane protein
MDLSQADFTHAAFWLAVLQIIWINILLSGDNAVVIAMACRDLPAKTRKWGIALGAGVAVVLRIIFTGLVATVLTWPWLKFVGAVALLYIAAELLKPQEEDHGNKIKSSDKLWRAVGTVAVADIVMSLDNVVAIAAAAKGSWTLLIFGLAVSIPLIVVGAALITALFVRFPILIWLGAALLGWIAGELMITDPGIDSFIGEAAVHRWEYFAAIAGALLVVTIGYIRRGGFRADKPEAKPAKPRQVEKKKQAAVKQPVPSAAKVKVAASKTSANKTAASKSSTSKTSASKTSASKASTSKTSSNKTSAKTAKR